MGTILILSIVILPLAMIALSNNAAFAMEELRPTATINRFLGRSDLRSGSRFLAAGNEIKKGDKCDPIKNNICPGISTGGNGGTELLQCCNTQCRDVVSDRNNCGACGNKCSFGQLCCGGKCTAVAYDVNNCGKCGVQCKAGVRCEYGTCGYAS